MPLSIKHPTRRKIYAFLRLAPGMHLRDLQRELAIPMGTLEHHLNKLEEMGKIVARSHERYKSYFPTKHVSRTDKTYLYFLHQDSPRHVVLALLESEDGLTGQDLSDRTGLSASTVSHHLRKLVQAELVEKTRGGRRILYRAAEPDRVRRLLLEYPGSYMESFGDWFRLAWAERQAKPPADDETGQQEPPTVG